MTDLDLLAEASLNPDPSITLVVPLAASTEGVPDGALASSTRQAQPLPIASQDDDLLSYLFVDSIYFKHLQKGSRKINADFTPPTADMDEILQICRRLRRTTDPLREVKRAMHLFTSMPVYQQHIASKDEKQIKAFHSHLKRYLSIHLKSNAFRLCTTSRYITSRPVQPEPLPGPSSATLDRVKADDATASQSGSESLDPPSTATSHAGLSPLAESMAVAALSEDVAMTEATAGVEDKAVAEQLVEPTPIVEATPQLPDLTHARLFQSSEVLDLAICATKALQPGDIISNLNGSLADLTNEQDDDLREDRNGMQSDFSVLMNPIRKVFQLFLGPARFCNHDCGHNVQMIRQGKSIAFKVLKPIRKGDEITSFYGEDYFEESNAACLCWSCERNLKGAFKPLEAELQTQVDDSTLYTASGRKQRKVVPEKPRIKPTHLAKFVEWDAECPVEESEDDEQLSEYDLAISEESEGEQEEPVDIFFRSRRPIAIQSLPAKQRRWAWMPMDVKVDAFKVPEVDITSGRSTRRQKNRLDSLLRSGETETISYGFGMDATDIDKPPEPSEEGKQVVTVSSMAEILNKIPTYTYGQWDEVRERKAGDVEEGYGGAEADDEAPPQAKTKSKSQSKSRTKKRKRAETPQDDPIDDTEFEPLRGKAKPAKKRKVDVRWLSPSSENDEVISQLPSSSRGQKHRIPDEAQASDYNLNVEEDREAWIGGLSHNSAGRWVTVKGWATADRECEEQRQKALQHKEDIEPSAAASMEAQNKTVAPPRKTKAKAKTSKTKS